MLTKTLVLLAALSLTLTSALYSPSDDVVMLNSANFNSRVIQSKELWFVEFFAPWCGHCKNLAPEWAKAAKALKGIVNIGAVDMDADSSVGAPYKIQGFPTIKIFGANKNAPNDYNGGRTAQAIVDEALNQLKSIVRERLSGGGSSGGSSGGSKSSGGSGDSKDVIELTESTFDSQVMGSDDIWLVEFYAPWWGHCKNLAPEWAKAATELKGKVKLGAVDSTVHQNLAQRYGIRGYPTIKFFPAGSKTQAEEYDGGRTSSDIVQWAMNKFAEAAPAPELVELVNQQKMDDACGENKQICLIAFMPQLYDCQSKCREKYLSTLKKMGDKYKRHQWSWLWTESAKYPELEQTLSVGGFGYPALVAVNARKGVFVLMRGSFSENGINEFLRELSFGRGATSTIPNNKLPAIKTTDGWDGKDAKIIEEEDIDLSDVSLDDDDSGIPIRKKTADVEL